MNATQEPISIKLPPEKQVFFASDFHLGMPNEAASRARERKIVDWLDTIAPQAHAIFLLGDLFDFWFEYKHVIPKGFIRFQGKLAELVDAGIHIIFFTGNHDLWLFDYFPKELGIPVYRSPHTVLIDDFRLYVGHGDGLGKGDNTYKLLKKIFQSRFLQWLFKQVHPDRGIGFANWWSRKSRAANTQKDEIFLGEEEWLWAYSKEIEKKNHHDGYIFGHRHLPLNLVVGEESRYIN
ncbi:MAG: UDP-2,3-diacylglucosamine diphosphatase, partial [Bacteroidota bacterium]